MTQIYFYSGVADKLRTACRLSSKAVQQGLKIMIYAPDMALLENLDKLLWTFSPVSFMPHCRADDKLVSMTPIVLCQEIERTAHYDVLINLDDQCPPFIDHFERLIEIAGTISEDKQAARQRYRFYQEKGYEIHHHKLED